MNSLVAAALSGALLSATPSPATAPDAAPLPPNHPTIAQPPPGHPPMQAGTKAPSAEELIKQLDANPEVRTGDKPFEIAATLGVLYASNARYQDAVHFFQQAEKKAAPLREVLASSLKVAKTPAADPKGCPQATTVEAYPAQLKSAALTPAMTAACASQALQPLFDATTRRANVHFLLGDPKAALQAYSTVLDVQPTFPEALWGKGALLLETAGDDVATLKQAKGLLERLTSTHPMHPRTSKAYPLIATADEAIRAGGMSRRAEVRAKQRAEKLAQGIPKPSAPAVAAARAPMQGGPMQQGGGKPSEEVVLTPEVVDAIKNTERTPELEAGLAKLVEEGEEHLARGRFDEALGAYRRVVPFQPENARARAGMAWALVKLNKQPMADRVWGVAASDAKAVDTLGETLKAKGDAAGAKALWTKLAAARPDYASSLQGKLK